jgi:CheY-like chemotaxis protein
MLQPRVVSLSVVAAGMRDMLARLIGEDVTMDYRCEAAGMVRVDPVQVEQVVMNLAINARDAMPSGGRLTVTTADVQLDAAAVQRLGQLLPGQYVSLVVADTGTGMTADVRSRVFEPFFTTKDVGKGSGLGLSTVYGIVTQSGGHIDLWSEPGQGTVFTAYFPRVDEPSECTPVAIATPRAGSPVLARSGTVLIAEDQSEVRDLLCDVLLGAGYRVLSAENGAEAMTVASEAGEPILLLITDVIMPLRGGVQLHEQLKARQPSLKTLFISGYTDSAMMRDGVMDIGAAYLQKPFTAHALLQRVREVVDG